jgi:hypothetical protein
MSATKPRSDATHKALELTSASTTDTATSRSHQAEAVKSAAAEPAQAAEQAKPNKEPLVHESAPGPAADSSGTLLLDVVTTLVQQTDPLRDLLAMLMRTMLSPLALQMLRIIVYKNKTIESPVFDNILQLVEKSVPATSKLTPTILRLAPYHLNKPKWMTEGQVNLF